jgi:hypothetical protein
LSISKGLEKVYSVAMYEGRTYRPADSNDMPRSSPSEIVHHLEYKDETKLGGEKLLSDNFEAIRAENPLYRTDRPNWLDQKTRPLGRLSKVFTRSEYRESETY